MGWTPLPQGSFKMNTYDSKRLDSRLDVAGGIIRDHQGNWVCDFTVNIGKTSSFFAESWGLREEMRIAKERGM